VLGADLPEARNQLVLDRLLRSRIVQGREQLEVYHDRIRAAILSALDAHQLHERHLQLAMALEESGCTDPEPLAMHYHSAGDRRKAGDYARRAAARAIETLAFNKAVEFYRLALQQDVWEARERVALGRSLADILSSAGRGTEAITAYMDAAACAEGGERLRLLSLAAAQLIRTGEIRRGTGLLSDVLDQAGLRSSKGNARRLFSIAQLRLRLRLRGFEFVTRTVDEIAPLDLLRLDLCGTATLAFAMTDPIRSAEFAARYLLLALEAGEPSRLALAFAGQATHVRLSSGRNGDAQAQAFLSRATELAEQANDARAKAVVRLMRGLVAYLGGDWKVAITECDTAAEMFRSTCTSIAWELSTAILFSLISLGNHGNWAEVRRRLPEIIRIAQGRGDLQLALHRILAPNFPSHLAVGDAEKAIELLNGAPGCWPNEQYNIQSCVSLLGRIEIYLYLGNPQEGWRHVEQEWPFLKRSRLLFLPTTFAIVRTARARLAVAMAAQASASSRERKRFLGLARRDARAVLRSGPAWSKGLAHAVLSGIASFAGDREQVKKQLRLADRALEAADQIGFRMGVRYRLARLEREPIASTLREDVQRWIAEQEIREPEQFCGMLVPGCWEQAVQYAVGSAD
jgi:tetratricopeptide (TPR) repeat protein